MAHDVRVMRLRVERGTFQFDQHGVTFLIENECLLIVGRFRLPTRRTRRDGEGPQSYRRIYCVACRVLIPRGPHLSRLRSYGDNLVLVPRDPRSLYRIYPRLC